MAWGRIVKKNEQSALDHNDDDFFEDEMYDLDNNHGAGLHDTNRRSISVDGEEAHDEETKFLLMKVINRNEAQERRIKRLEESISKMRSPVVAQQNRGNIVMGFKSLSQDTYNLMMLSDGFFNRDWQLGFVVFLFQLGLGVLTLYSQLVSSESEFNDTILQIPIHTKPRVTALQMFAIFVAVYYQEDVFNAIAFPIDFRLDGPHPWGGIPIAEDEKKSKAAWRIRILIPNVFKFSQGFVVFITSLIVIIQSTSVIDLLKDFTSLYVISSIDDITFSVARRGFFGTGLLVKAARAEEIEISSFDVSSQESDEDGHRRWSDGTIIKTTVLHIILAVSVSAWIIVFVLQGKGFFAERKYPKCESAVPSFKSEWKLLENNNCDIVFNHPDCAYDGGDCSEFNLIYPGCEVEDMSLLGNGECDGSPYDSKLCRFDGGDCSIENVIKAKYPLCEQAVPSFRSNWTMVENEKCDMIFNIPECGLDGGDCVNFNLFYPGCNEVKDFEIIDSSRIGDGVCDGYPSPAAECSFDGGDCRIDAPYCASSKKGTLGDGICDDELHIWECYFDRGDCLNVAFSPNIGDSLCTSSYFDIFYSNYDYEGGDCIHPGYESCIFTSSHPNFVEEVSDDKCHNTWFHNKEECGWDGGDCIEFNRKYPNCTDSNTILNNPGVQYPTQYYDYYWQPENNPKAEAWRLGDGVCNAAFNTSECGYDEGDCCINAIKDEKCDQRYNTVECGWDKGDCIEFNQKYPDCILENFQQKKLGDSECDSYLNTEECGWDGGDCIEFNRNYPNCKVYYPRFIGDGVCADGEYNTEECGWDGGDCIEFNAKYPNCTVDYPSSIGDGRCFGGAYNTEECGWDGGDCLIAEYPGCHVDTPHFIGDGRCYSGAYNTEECGFDGGDCIEFNVNYPNCNVEMPSWIGDGYCNRYGEYNTEDCGWDGGDCDAENEPNI